MSIKKCRKHIAVTYPGAKLLTYKWKPECLSFRCSEKHYFKKTWKEIKNGGFCPRCNTHGKINEVNEMVGAVAPIVDTVRGMFTDTIRDFMSLRDFD